MRICTLPLSCLTRSSMITLRHSTVSETCSCRSTKIKARRSHSLVSSIQPMVLHFHRQTTGLTLPCYHHNNSHRLLLRVSSKRSRSARLLLNHNRATVSHRTTFLSGPSLTSALFRFNCLTAHRTLIHQLSRQVQVPRRHRPSSTEDCLYHRKLSSNQTKQ